MCSNKYSKYDNCIVKIGYYYPTDNLVLFDR